jgi:hypothetical protein
VIDSSEKEITLSKWFEGDHVLLHLDARRDGVDVPVAFRTNHSLTLKVSGLFQGPTTWNQQSVVALLKFNGEYFRCVIPWNAIWGMTSAQSEQKIWPEDLPTEVVRDLTLTKLREIGSRLLGIKKEKEDVVDPPAEGPDSSYPDDSGPRKRKPTLTRIK